MATVSAARYQRDLEDKQKAYDDIYDRLAEQTTEKESEIRELQQQFRELSNLKTKHLTEARLASQQIDSLQEQLDDAREKYEKEAETHKSLKQSYEKLRSTTPRDKVQFRVELAKKDEELVSLQAKLLAASNDLQALQEKLDNTLENSEDAVKFYEALLEKLGPLLEKSDTECNADNVFQHIIRIQDLADIHQSLPRNASSTSLRSDRSTSSSHHAPNSARQRNVSIGDELQGLDAEISDDEVDTEEADHLDDRVTSKTPPINWEARARSLDKSHADLQARFKELEKASSTKRRSSVIDQEVDTEIKKLQAERDESREALAMMQEKMKQVNGGPNAHSQLSGRVAQLQSQLDDMMLYKSQVDSLTIENQNLVHRVKELEEVDVEILKMTDVDSSDEEHDDVHDKAPDVGDYHHTARHNGYDHISAEGQKLRVRKLNGSKRNAGAIRGTDDASDFDHVGKVTNRQLVRQISQYEQEKEALQLENASLLQTLVSEKNDQDSQQNDDFAEELEHYKTLAHSLQRALDDLRQQMLKYRALDYEALQSEVDALRQQNQDLQNDLMSSSSVVNSLKQQNADLQQTVEAIESDVSRVAELAQKNTELEMDIQGRQSAIERFQLEIRELQQKSKAADIDHAQKIRDMRDDLASVRMKFSQRQQAVEELKKQNEGLEAKMVRQDRARVEMQNENAELQQDLRGMKDLQRKLDDLATGQGQSIVEMKVDNARLKQHLSRPEELHRDYRDTGTQVCQENIRLELKTHGAVKAHVLDFQTNKDSESDINACENKIRSLKSKLQVVEDRCSQVQAEKARLEIENEDLLLKLEDMGVSQHRESSEDGAQNVDVVNLKSEHDSLALRYADLQRDYSSLQDSEKTLEAEIKGLKDSLDKLEVDKLRLESDKRDLVHESSIRASELAKSRKHITALSGDNQQLLDLQSSLTIKIKDLEDRAKRLPERHEGQKQRPGLELDHIDGKVTELEARIVSLRSENAKLKSAQSLSADVRVGRSPASVASIPRSANQILSDKLVGVSWWLHIFITLIILVAAGYIYAGLKERYLWLAVNDTTRTHLGRLQGRNGPHSTTSRIVQVLVDIVDLPKHIFS